MITAGEIRMETVESLCACLATNTVAKVFFIQSGPYLDNGRNEIVRTFRLPEVRDYCTHLLMVDSDIAFTPDDVRALYAAAEERAVVGGVYYNNFSGTIKPIVYGPVDIEVDGVVRHSLKEIDHWADGWEFWPKDQTVEGLDPLVKVDAMGAGFLMIRYEVLDVMEAVHGEPQPFFDEPVIDGVHFGEDLAFCLRAYERGFSVWAHREVEVAHVKSVMLGNRPDYKMETP
jgi:GT2 family glycosyltransferase